jgi:hypothetical protein
VASYNTVKVWGAWGFVDAHSQGRITFLVQLVLMRKQAKERILALVRVTKLFAVLQVTSYGWASTPFHFHNVPLEIEIKSRSSYKYDNILYKIDASIIRTILGDLGYTFDFLVNSKAEGP